MAVTASYKTYGQPGGTETIIPATQGWLAGTDIAVDRYLPTTGLISSYEDSAAGGLPQETYDATGQPTSRVMPLLRGGIVQTKTPGP
jgi:hypothetical protein